MKKSIIAFTTLLAATLPINVCYAGQQMSDQELKNIMRRGVNQMVYNANKELIIKAYQKYFAATERRDVNQIFEIFAPNFRSIGIDGKITNLAQQRQMAQINYPNARNIKVSYKIEQIQIKGNMATARGFARYNGSVISPQNSQILVPYSYVYQYQDTWKYTSSGWKIISNRILQEKLVGGLQPSQANTNVNRPLTDAEEALLFEQQAELLRIQIQAAEDLRNQILNIPIMKY